MWGFIAMGNKYLELKVIQNTEGIALLCGQFRARGRLLVCDRCGDPGQTIVAILTLGVPGKGLSFAVCGPCFQLLPQGAIVA